jgi:hypothetical protein
MKSNSCKFRKLIYEKAPQFRENMVKISLHGLEQACFTSKITRNLHKALFRILVKMCQNRIAILQSPQSAQ